MSEYLRGLIASHEDEIEASFDADQRAADCAASKEESRRLTRDLNMKRECCPHGHRLDGMAEGTVHCDECSAAQREVKP